MVQYRICKYSFYDKKEYCIEQKAWFTFGKWKPVRNLEGDIITDTKEHIKYLIYCWTEKPKITPLDEENESSKLKIEELEMDNVEYTQISYITDGKTKAFYGKKCLIEFDYPLPPLTVIKIKEIKE